MKLWKISQETNQDYDVFDSAIVAAATEQDAKAIHPYGGIWPGWSDEGSWCATWCATPDDVTAEYIGETDRAAGEVILGSFNAG